jgi:hypothetical protein
MASATCTLLTLGPERPLEEKADGIGVPLVGVKGAEKEEVDAGKYGSPPSKYPSK